METLDWVEEVTLAEVKYIDDTKLRGPVDKKTRVATKAVTNPYLVHHGKYLGFFSFIFILSYYCSLGQNPMKYK